MRYFKYKKTHKNLKNALKEQYKTLTEDEKRTVRKEKTWRKISESVSGLVFILCMGAGAFMLKQIPTPDGLVLKILGIIGIVIAAFGLFIICGLITLGLTAPLWKKAESFHLPAMKKEFFSKACGHLRKYYGLQEPYIVTKCFDSTKKEFRNHDVCIFVVRNELRITTDLVKGFLHGERDLGCFAFKRNEITLSKRQDAKHLIAELKAKDTTFLLGYRAKGFIEKVFISQQPK